VALLRSGAVTALVSLVDRARSLLEAEPPAAVEDAASKAADAAAAAVSSAASVLFNLSLGPRAAREALLLVGASGALRWAAEQPGSAGDRADFLWAARRIEKAGRALRSAWARGEQGRLRRRPS
jgi:hypothetical protein